MNASTTNALREGRGVRANPSGSSGSQPTAKTRIWIPYLKFSGVRLDWALSWRSCRAADLLGIWNGPKPLDKGHNRAS